VNRKFQRLAWTALLTFALVSANAADKLTIRIGNQTISAWRTADLESAKAEAAAAHKPIAWIAASPKAFDGKGNISEDNPRGATLHAFYALRSRTILVFEDAYTENHKVLQLVDDALHTPNPHYTPPTVVFLDPAATQVLATVTFESDFAKRAHALADALDQVKPKMETAAAATKP
jgi:hypothetical protein